MTVSDTKIRTSTDGIEYETLSTPCKVELEIASVSKNTNVEDYGGFPVYHIYVKCNEIDQKLLPLDANPREPRSTKQVKAMQEELKESPSNFVKKNNGLTVLSRGVEIKEEEEGKAVLDFKTGREGVCNGGHTYFSIKTTQFEIDDNALAHLEVIEIPELGDQDQEIVDIARARNNNNSLKKKSEADFLGYYDEFKDYLSDDSLVSWHEGDSNAHEYSIDATHFIRLCYALNPLEFRHSKYNPEGSNHMQTARAKSKYHRKWFKSRSEKDSDELKHMRPLVNDMMYLRDYLSSSLLNDTIWGGYRKTNLFNDNINRNKPRDLHLRDLEGEEGANLSPTLEVMLMGLFRSNVYVQRDEKGEIHLIGWVEDPKKRWEESKEEIMKSWKRYYKEAGGDPQSFTRTSAAYEKELFRLGTGQEMPAPEIVYSVETGRKFERSDINKDYALDREKGRGMIQLENSEAEDYPTYEEV